MESLPGLAVAFVAALVVLYFLVFRTVFRTKTDPRVAALADIAYACAGTIAKLPAKGTPPTVNLKKGRWRVDGVSVIGNYKWRMVFGKVIWDRILVIDIADSIWPNLVHEMTHAVRRRAGLPSSEAAAEAAEAVAYSSWSAVVDALVEKFK